jgi:hypothetical protein
MGMKRFLLSMMIVVLSLVMVGCTLSDVPEGTIDALDPPTIVLADEATAEAEPTEEASPTDEPVPELTDEPEDEEDEVDEPDEDPEDDPKDEDLARAGCEGNEGSMPASVETLAKDYDVAVEDVMAWFCQGYGLGEITEAYRLSEASGKSVEEIFAMREQGMGWGNIKKELDVKPGKGCNPHDEDCDKDKPGKGCSPHDEDCDKDKPGKGCNPHDVDCDKSAPGARGNSDKKDDD